MRPSWRVQVGLVALAYIVVSLFAAAVLYVRHLQELKYPAEASGGMWAAGDAMLLIFIVCLFMIPTGFLIWVLAGFESIYNAYSKILLALSLSAPVCLGLLTFSASPLASTAGGVCLFRLLSSPFILLGIGVSRFVARVDRAKRLVSYALLIEALTLVTAVALVVHAWVGAKAH